MSIYKRIGSLILSLLLVFSMFGSTFAIQTFAATTTVLSAESKSVSAGEQFTVAVNLSNATSIYDGNFTLQYDNDLLTADSYSFGSIVSEHNKSCNLNYQSVGNLIRMTFYGTSSISANGTLVTITFTAKEDVSGTAALQFTNYKMYDLNGSSVTTTANGSNITITDEPVISPTISVANKSVTVGDTFSVPVLISDSESVYDGNFTLQYDSDLLTVNSYSYGSVVDSHNKNCNLDYQSAGNLIRFTFNGTSALSSDGTLVTFNFTAKSAGAATLKFTDYKMYDKNGSSIDTTATGNNIVVGENTVPNVKNIQVYSQPDKDVYLVGEELDTTGLGIVVTYTDGTISYIKSGFSTSGFDSYQEGQQTITVSYGGRTTSFKVRVDADGIFTISFDANGGSNAPKSQTYMDNTPYTLTDEIPIRENYLFIGWATSNDATKADFNAGSEISMSAGWYGDFTLYAVWQLNVISGECGDNAYYELTLNTGELVISGSGAMYDYEYTSYVPWYSYYQSVKKVIVESGVTQIGNYAFSNLSNLTDVIISDSVTSIRCRGFAYCYDLVNIDFGKGLTDIGEAAFVSCDSLTTVTIPSNVESIGDYAFSACDILSSITLENGIKEIGSNAFQDCYVLKSVTLPNSVTSLGNSVFSYCDELTSVTIPKSVTSIGVSAFYESENVTVYGYRNSYAETYASEYDVPFVALDSVELIAVSVVNSPNNTVYYIGDSLNTSGLEIELTYDDGTTETITSGFTTSGFSSTTAGTKTVTVSYEGFTDTFAVTVKTPSIALSASSKSMTVGDSTTLTATTTPSGQTVTWTSSNTSVATVTGGMITAKAFGSATITAKFTYNGKTYSKTCSVTVADVPTPTPVSLSVISKPTKTVYEIGESLNTSGLKLKLTYSDGTYETITSGFTTSGFSSATAGTKTVTVKHSGLTTTFTVTVNAPVPVYSGKLIVSSTETMAGKEVTLTLTIKDNPGVAGLAVSFKYDETVLTLKDSENGGLFNGFTAGKNFAWDESENVTDDGVLATFIFTVAEDAPAGDYSVEVIVRSCTNEDLDDVELSTTAGVVSVSDFMYGDSNGDNKIDMKDVVLLRKYITNFDYDTNTSSVNVELGADANGDNKIDMKDVVILRKYITNYDYDTESSTVVLGPQQEDEK